MSLILEALRKSEAERRRGQAPDLHTELPPTARAARSRRPAWPWLLAAATVAAAAALATMWLAPGPWTPTPATVEREPLPDQARPSLPDSAGAANDRDRTETGVGRPDATAPVVHAPPPVTAPPDAAAPVVEATPSIVAPPDTPPPAADAAPASEHPAAPSPAPPAAVATPTQPSRPAMPRPAPAPPLPAPTPPAPEATTAVIDKRAPLHLADLPAAERKVLPPLKISMHMWAPTPAGRFAIIDGARVDKGDRLGDAVVEEITRDGVVLAWRGRRVQVPIH